MKTILLNWKHFWVENYKDYSLLLAQYPNILLAPPAPMLSWFAERHPNQVVAQEVTPHEFGAYTGALGPAYLKKMGIHKTIIGHQEQRARAIDDSYIQQQYLCSLRHDLKPILCIGEKNQHCYQEELLSQILFLQDLEVPIFLAYEPLWAIGQKQHCPPDHITDVFAFIKEQLPSADIQDFFYGGSILAMERQLLEHPVLTGFLIGRLSLSLDPLSEFLKDYQQHIDKYVEA